MGIGIGDKLPDAQVIRATANGPKQTSISELTAGRKTVIFAVPGAFTPTCDSAHMPSFVRTAHDFSLKGVDEIMCLSVNDAHVMRVWGEHSGALNAGIGMIADPVAEFTKAMGMAFTALPVGMIDRSARYAMVVEDGTITKMHVEEIGVCAVSTGEAMLEAL